MEEVSSPNTTSPAQEATAERRRESYPASGSPPPVPRIPFDALVQPRGMIDAVLYRFAVPARDRPDVRQEVLLSAWRSMEAGRFRPPQHVPLMKALKRWLFGVTWRHISHYRERQHRWYKELAAYTSPRFAYHAPSPYRQIEARLAIHQLSRLEPELRNVLVGTALGRTASEIAAALGRNPTTTNKRMHRGRRRLQKLLSGTRWRGRRA